MKRVTEEREVLKRRYPVLRSSASTKRQDKNGSRFNSAASFKPSMVSNIIWNDDSDDDIDFELPPIHGSVSSLHSESTNTLAISRWNSFADDFDDDMNYYSCTPDLFSEIDEEESDYRDGDSYTNYSYGSYTTSSRCSNVSA